MKRKHGRQDMIALPRVPFVDLHAQYQSLQAEINSAIAEVISRSAFIGGAFVARFEQEFAAFCEVKHCVAVSNGTDALYLAMKALGIAAADEVITVPNTFIATTEAITRTGARIRFVDVNAQTLNMDVASLERAITPRTKALVPVHLYGQPADMDPIRAIAKKHGLFVIEDAAQAHGASYKGKRVGGLGDVACFSFYPGKNLGAYGDAGAVVTDDENLAIKVRKFSDHGRLAKYEHLVEGYNHRCDGLQAGVLRVKLRYMEEWNKVRRAHAALYGKLLQDANSVKTPFVISEAVPVYHLYVIQIDHRDELQKYLAEQGIATGVHYPIPLHLQPAYQYMNLPCGSFPVVEAAASRILSLPMYPELTNEMIEYVAKTLSQLFGGDFS